MTHDSVRGLQCGRGGSGRRRDRQNSAIIARVPLPDKTLFWSRRSKAITYALTSDLRGMSTAQLCP